LLGFIELKRVLFLCLNELILTMIDCLDIARMVALLNIIIALNNINDLVRNFHYVFIQKLFLF
jgi:hypothetical protein